MKSAKIQIIKSEGLNPKLPNVNFFQTRLQKLFSADRIMEINCIENQEA